MPQERSAGAVVFRREKGKIVYLLLQYEKGHWEFPRGLIGDTNKDESETDAVMREIQEETGITDAKLIDGFRETSAWFFKRDSKVVHKEAAYHLAETSQEKVTLSAEHKDFAWLPFEAAIEKATFKNAKDILRKADAFLREHGVQ